MSGIDDIGNGFAQGDLLDHGLLLNPAGHKGRRAYLVGAAVGVGIGTAVELYAPRLKGDPGVRAAPAKSLINRALMSTPALIAEERDDDPVRAHSLTCAGGESQPLSILPGGGLGYAPD